MNKIRNILEDTHATIGTAQAEEEIIELIEKLVPKRYDSDPPQNEYEEGMECAYRIIEKRIAKLKEE